MNGRVIAGSGRFGLRDLVPAVPLLLIVWFGTDPAADGQEELLRDPDVYAYALVTVAAVALLLRRIAPLRGLAVNGVVVTVYLALGYPFGPVLLTTLVAAYAVGARVLAQSALVSAGLVLAVTIPAAGFQFVIRDAHFLIFDSGSPLWALLLWSLVWTTAVGGSMALGAVVRSQMDVRAAQAHRAASEERLRMAQDLHDSVGHGLAVIAMQAGVGLHVHDRNPDKVREILETIRSTSRESLDGLRTELAAMRSPDDVPGRRPATGLTELPRLVDRVRAGGVAVELICDEVGELPADVGEVVYRITQESLTNALRHADASGVRVRVQAAESGVVLEVRDDGNGRDLIDLEEGSGVAGMRARARSLGGTLDIGAGPAGGFVIRAYLPVSARVGGA